MRRSQALAASEAKRQMWLVPFRHTALPAKREEQEKNLQSTFRRAEKREHEHKDFRSYKHSLKLTLNILLQNVWCPTTSVNRQRYHVLRPSSHIGSLTLALLKHSRSNGGKKHLRPGRFLVSVKADLNWAYAIFKTILFWLTLYWHSAHCVTALHFLTDIESTSNGLSPLRARSSLHSCSLWLLKHLFTFKTNSEI